jgi:hypothetical protein
MFRKITNSADFFSMPVRNDLGDIVDYTNRLFDFALETKKKFKPLMVSILQYCLEEGMLKSTVQDDVLKGQFMDYKVKNISDSNVTYVRENEHGVDATGLALFGVYRTHLEMMRADPAWKSVRLPMLEITESPRAREEKEQFFGRNTPWHNDRGARGFSRGYLGPSRRPKF